MEPLIELLGDEDASLRTLAADCLGRIGDPRAVTPLVGRLGDKAKQVSLVAAKSLHALSRPAAASSWAAPLAGGWVWPARLRAGEISGQRTALAFCGLLACLREDVAGLGQFGLWPAGLGPGGGRGIVVAAQAARVRARPWGLAGVAEPLGRLVSVCPPRAPLRWLGHLDGTGTASGGDFGVRWRGGGIEPLAHGQKAHGRFCVPCPFSSVPPRSGLELADALERAVAGHPYPRAGQSGRGLRLSRLRQLMQPL